MLTFLAALALQTPAPVADNAVWTQPELERVANEIRAEVEELRGMKFKGPVAVKLTDKAGFFEYARRRQAATETPEKAYRDETVAKLLGLIPASMDYQKEMLKILEEQVGGFYDPKSSTFYLMETFTGGVAKIILAHELTHALDDQHFDIDGTLAQCGDETDATLAYQAVVEGSGTGLMNQWYMKHLSEITPADLAAAQGLGAETLAKSPPYMWKPLLAVYLLGDSFLARSSGMNLTLKKAALSDIQATFAAPPKSTEQILHSNKYWNADERDDPIRITIDTSALPEGWQVAGVDTLGELYLALLTTPPKKRKGLDVTSALAVMGVNYTNAAAEGWGGDRCVLLRNGDDTMLQLVTAWDTAKDADEFAAALGDPARPSSIPVFKGSGRDAESGWIRGASATQAVVTRELAADGQTPLVVLRVFSLQAPATEKVIEQLKLPYSLAGDAR
ncbi:MAG: hypothetical protein JNL28_11465 [Planctomycetes bacterium]|nr:hypothetical protein [Planctomycetota bacterium]